LDPVVKYALIMLIVPLLTLADTDKTPFEEQPKSYVCPQCMAPKKRFAPYDVETGKTKGGAQTAPVISLVAGLIAAAGIAYGIYVAINE